jgi:hypothetical protein
MSEITLETLIDAILADYRATELPIQPRTMAAGVCRVLYSMASVEEYESQIDGVCRVILKRLRLAEQKQTDRELYRS